MKKDWAESPDTAQENAGKLSYPSSNDGQTNRHLNLHSNVELERATSILLANPYQ